MAGTYNDLKNYIEQLCTRHTDILHRQYEDHFTLQGMEELLVKIRSTLAFPAVILADYDYSFGDAKSDNPLKNRSVAVVFLDHAEDADDYDEIAGIYNHMEQVADDFINRMRNDSQNNRHAFLKDIDFDSITGVQFQGPDNNFGIWLPVVIRSTHDFRVENEKWTDL